jgi:predicted Zn finger-like uncharacterized protein
MGAHYRHAAERRMNEPQMITRCPECGTAFRVTQGQLLLREGRVRCGHCSAVFDARESLEILTEPSAALQPTHEEVAPPDSTTEGVAPDASLEAVEQPLPPLAEEDAPPEPLAEEDVQVPSEASEQFAPEPAPSPVATELPEAPAFRKPSVEPTETPMPATEPPPRPAAPPAPALKRRTVVEEPLPEFLPDKPKRRLAWGLLAALLLVMLNVQAIFYFRGAIALMWPAAKPAIEAMCARLRCELPLPKRADLMSIETSDLQAEPAAPDVMVLSATLRNRAAFPQAYPALELTLTNERDEALARRVLQPGDYLRPSSSPRVADGIPTCSGGVASCEVQVRLHLEAASLKASGYRLYLFYP